MKRKFIILLLSFAFFSCHENGINFDETPFKAQVEFIKTYGGSKNDVATSVIKTDDLGYAVFGYTASTNGDVSTKKTGDFDYWLLKFSWDDKLQFKKTYGGTKDDKGANIIQTKDGGYAILGSSKSNDKDVTSNAGNNDFWLVKLNRSGTINWEKSFGYSGSDEGNNLIQTKDGGFLVVGSLDVTASGGNGNFTARTAHAGSSYWAIKLDEKGEMQWSRYFGGNATDIATCVTQLQDEGFIIFGYSDSSDVDVTNNKGTTDFWGLRITKEGSVIWKKNFGGSNIDKAFAISETSDGNYLITGKTNSNDKDVTVNNGGYDAWILKLSPFGKVIWQKSIGGVSTDVNQSVTKSKNDGFIIAGNSKNSNTSIANKGQNDAWVYKITNKGNVLWQKGIGGSNDDYFYDVIELANGKIVAVGETQSIDKDIKTNKGQSDVLIVKIK